MSVQAGIWNFDGRPVDHKLLMDISDFLKEQGPDGESHYVVGSVALLYRPFHTTAESRREKQPYLSPQGFILMWDGRLDNRDELFLDLRGDLEENPTDVAIVAAAFDRWENDCFRRIVGDWAVSIWKPEQRELLLAADYMAIRHIFYYLKDDRIWWSTDLSPLVLLSGDKFHINEDYIAGYLAQDPDAWLSPYREIREVPPGQFVRICKGRAFVERYWRFDPKSRIRYKTDAEYEEHFRHAFRRSVQRRLRSDSPVLAELSGGLDSSSIVCVADGILAQGGAQTPRVDTLSYCDPSEPGADDAVYRQQIEVRRGRTGNHIDLTRCGDSSLQNGEFMPLPGSLGIGRIIAAERASVIQRRGCRAVLSGMGGDEFNGGNPDPREQLADLIVQFRLIQFARQLMAWSLAKRKPWVQLLWQSSIILLPRYLAQHVDRHTKIEPWIDRSFARRTGLKRRMLGPQPDSRAGLPSHRSYLAGVIAVSNITAKIRPLPFAVEELRFPYLDQNFVEFILSIPATQILRPGERRSLMRRSLVQCVPQELLSRRTKQLGGRTSTAALMKTAEELRNAFEHPISAEIGVIDQSEFRNAIQATLNGKQHQLVRFLRGISLELWLRDHAARNLLHSTTAPASVNANFRRAGTRNAAHDSINSC
jgi:asparagine synthase (glutamine-hydrolysing)